MVKNYICYESVDKGFISNIAFNKIMEYLVLETRIYHEDTDEVSYDCTELAVDNDQIRALRDFLNSLNLRGD